MPPTSKVAGHHFSVTGVLQCAEYLAEHRLRDKAAGKPVVTLPLVLYTDETSQKRGTYSTAGAVVLLGSCSHNSQLGNIHFVCCSDRVSVLDMIVEQLLDLERDGTMLYDAHLD